MVLQNRITMINKFKHLNMEPIHYSASQLAGLLLTKRNEQHTSRRSITGNSSCDELQRDVV